MRFGPHFVGRVTEHCLESDVRRAWSAIISDVFTFQEDYGISHEHHIGSRRIDLDISRLVNGREMNFLVVELKRSSYAKSSAALLEAETQLIAYMNSLKSVDDDALWGALCIGKNVQFYQAISDGEGFELHCLHEGMLRIDRQPVTVKGWLERIKADVG